MNYYIDFDNTLFNTTQLIEKMLNSIVKTSCTLKKLDEQKLYEECKELFNPNHIYNIYELVKYVCDKYDLEIQLILSNLNGVILNSSDLVFEDSIKFLKDLRSKNHNIFLLSYASQSLEYQTLKIIGSGLVNYFDALYITSKPKYNLDIDYENGIFIDDNTEDLKGLYSKHPYKLIRLRRKENIHSIQNLENIDIEEYSDFSQIII